MSPLGLENKKTHDFGLHGSDIYGESFDLVGTLCEGEMDKYMRSAEDRTSSKHMAWK